MQESFSQLNWFSILVAALSTFLIGGLWYSIFEKQWLKENNISKEKLNERKIINVFGLSFLFSIIMAMNLAMFIGKKADFSFGMLVGFLTGFGWIFFSIAIISLFENKPLKYVLINGGYMIVSFTVMGAILGAWH